jgi:hypothetical protein
MARSLTVAALAGRRRLETDGPLMDFRGAWERVAALEGESFTTDRGDVFRYRFKKTFVVVEPGEQSIPRTNFEKVFRQNPKPVQGQRYIQSILSDLRFTMSEPPA